MTYSFSQLYQILQNAGASQAEAAIGAAVGLAESGGNPNIPGDQGRSLGVWQFFAPTRQSLGMSDNCAVDPVCSAPYVLQLARNSPKGWNNWTTYTSGTYRKFLSDIGFNPSNSPNIGPGQVSDQTRKYLILGTAIVLLVLAVSRGIH